MITVTDFSQAIKLLSSAQGEEITLVTPISCSSYLGVSYFLSFNNKIKKIYPSYPFKFFLDCDDNAGEALAAIRSGVKYVLFTGKATSKKRLKSLADKMGCELRFIR